VIGDAGGVALQGGLVSIEHLGAWACSRATAVGSRASSSTTMYWPGMTLCAGVHPGVVLSWAKTTPLAQQSTAAAIKENSLPHSYHLSWMSAGRCKRPRLTVESL
jgi:hypothetical protein